MVRTATMLLTVGNEGGGRRGRGWTKGVRYEANSVSGEI